jgi:RNA polymerase subunit RPABC4/transcription elongation factor Spt4
MTPSIAKGRVIPLGAWITAGALTALFFLVSAIVLSQAGVPLIARVLGPIFLSVIVGGYTLLVGYVYGDARRRGMRYVMWTLLAIFLTNGIGIILYFILREPMPLYCSRCGGATQQGFAYCPRCGANVLPACPACSRVVQPGWSHCAWCGANFSIPAPH